jgi:hypothetical protein
MHTFRIVTLGVLVFGSACGHLALADVPFTPWTAIGDGVTDDTNAIQTYLDTSPSRIVVIPPGTFKINGDGLQINRPVIVIGAGPANTTFICAPRPRNAVLSISDTHDVYLTGFSIDCGWPKITAGQGINIFRSSRVRIDGLNIRNVNTNGIGVHNGQEVWITRNSVSNTGCSAIQTMNEDNGKTFVNSGIHIEDNVVDLPAQYGSDGTGGIGLGGDVGITNVKCTIKRNIVTRSGCVGIGLSAYETVIEGNVVVGLNGTNSPFHGEGIAFTGGDNLIANNYVAGSDKASGILLFATTNVPSHNNVISGNRVTRSGAQGIALVWGMEGAEIDGVTVTDNVVFNNFSYGIMSYLGTDPRTGRSVVEHSARNIIVRNNSFSRGNAYGMTVQIYNHGDQLFMPFGEGVTYIDNRPSNADISDLAQAAPGFMPGQVQSVWPSNFTVGSEPTVVTALVGPEPAYADTSNQAGSGWARAENITVATNTIVRIAVDRNVFPSDRTTSVSVANVQVGVSQRAGDPSPMDWPTSSSLGDLPLHLLRQVLDLPRPLLSNRSRK